MTGRTHSYLSLDAPLLLPCNSSAWTHPHGDARDALAQHLLILNVHPFPDILPADPLLRCRDFS